MERGTMDLFSVILCFDLFSQNWKSSSAATDTCNVTSFVAFKGLKWICCVLHQNIVLMFNCNSVSQQKKHVNR